ncbi:MAG: GNAT family N-acetyltransferase [Gammaproteobacteria bacterium]|nr:GNAT family N-acetyltransferase [Gammaproteobacteria bacterium]
MVDLREGADAHWNKLDGKIRRNVKRVFTRANAAGETVVGGLRFFERTSGSCEAVMKRAIALTNTSQKMRDAEREMSDYHQQFYHELVELLGPKAMVDVAILTISGEDAAFLMALVERGVYYDVTVSFAEKFKNVFPGIFLMHELLRQLPGKGIHTVISHGAYEYKRNWATSFVPVKTAYLVNRGWRARLAYFGHFVLMPFIRRIMRRNSV